MQAMFAHAKAVLFDLDGTAIDSFHRVAPCRFIPADAGNRLNICY